MPRHSRLAQEAKLNLTAGRRTKTHAHTPPTPPHPEPNPGNGPGGMGAVPKVVKNNVTHLIEIGDLKLEPLPDTLREELEHITDPATRTAVAMDFVLSQVAHTGRLDEVAAVVGVSTATLIMAALTDLTTTAAFAMALGEASHVHDEVARKLMDGRKAITGPAAGSEKISGQYAISYRASSEHLRRTSESMWRRCLALDDNAVIKRKAASNVRKAATERHKAEAERWRKIEAGRTYDAEHGYPPPPPAHAIQPNGEVLTEAELCGLTPWETSTISSMIEGDDEADAPILQKFVDEIRHRWRRQHTQMKSSGRPGAAATPTGRPAQPSTTKTPSKPSITPTHPAPTNTAKPI